MPPPARLRRMKRRRAPATAPSPSRPVALRRSIPRALRAAGVGLAAQPAHHRFSVRLRRPAACPSGAWSSSSDLIRIALSRTEGPPGAFVRPVAAVDFDGNGEFQCRFVQSWTQQSRRLFSPRQSPRCSPPLRAEEAAQGLREVIVTASRMRSTPSGRKGVAQGEPLGDRLGDPCMWIDLAVAASPVPVSSSRCHTRTAAFVSRSATARRYRHRSGPARD